MSKILIIYGLSANPPTLAHKKIIECVRHMFYDETLYDFWVIPTFKHPIKTNLIDFDHRFEMLRLMCQSMSGVVISDIERDVSTSCSAELVEYILDRFPIYNDIVFVCDYTILIDTLTLSRYGSERLIYLVNFYVILNDDNDNEQDIRLAIELSENTARMSFIELPQISDRIRSTHVRENKDDTRESLLDPTVYSYIREHGLY